MDNINENKLMDKISSVLREINKNEDNVKNAYFSMSIFEAKQRFKSNKISHKKADKTPVLSNNEKKRYGNIGDNFLKGASHNYIDIIEKIKKEEKKKFKEKQKELESIEKSETDDVKKKIKQSKKSSKSKLILLSVAIGGVAFLMKKTYDSIFENNKSFNILKILSNFLPKKIIFRHSNPNKEEVSSFVLETTSDEEVPLTNKQYKNNPIIEAAKSFDDILLNWIFNKGFNNLLNNINENNSTVGYIIFNPAKVIINKLIKFVNEALTTTKYFHGMGADMFHLIQTIMSPLISVKEILGRDYAGRYNTLMVKSSDEYTQTMYQLERLLKESMPNDSNNKVGFFYDDSLIVKAGFDSSTFSKIKNNIEGNSKDFLERLRSFSSFGGIKIDDSTKNATGLTTIKLETNFTSDLNDFYFFVEGENKRNINVGKSFPLARFLGLKDWDNPKEALEIYRNYIRNNTTIDNWISKLEGVIENDIPSLMIKARAWYLYNEEFLKPREQLLEIASDNIFTSESNAIDSYLQNTIYFNNKIPTKRKIKYVLDTYFNGIDRNKNFLMRRLDKMENQSEWSRIKSLSKINHFRDVISPLHYFENEEENIINQFYNSPGVKLISQHNNTYGAVAMNNESLLFKISNFYNSKLNAEITIQEGLEKILDYFKTLYIKCYNNYKQLYKTSRGYKIDSKYDYKKRDNSLTEDLIINFVLHLDDSEEIKSNPIGG